MIDKEFDTGMTLNKYPFLTKARGPKNLSISKNSAFCILRKRTRDELPYEDNSEFKLVKLWEYPTTNWENSIISKSSNASSSMIQKEIPQPSKIETPALLAQNNDSKGELKMKVLKFTPYQALDMKTRHDFYTQTLKNIGNQWIRGRKRINISSKASSFSNLLEEIVIPEWKSYLNDKKEKENASKNFGLRSDAVWKKLFRDCREFFRILFKHRFHRMDYKSYLEKLNCIKVMSNELGLPIFSEENLIFSFNFFHQIHLSEKNKEKYKDILSK